MEVCHSPLTGIFLIRSHSKDPIIEIPTKSQSPDGDFFDPEASEKCFNSVVRVVSQSPDGDFFDPELPNNDSYRGYPASHSPLTGIFLIRS